VRWLEAHPLSAQQIFQRLREAGYPVASPSSTVCARIARRNAKVLEVDLRPGECAQIDWGEYGRSVWLDAPVRLSFFGDGAMLLRQMYVEFTVSQTMEHSGCHERASRPGVPDRYVHPSVGY